MTLYMHQNCYLVTCPRTSVVVISAASPSVIIAPASASSPVIVSSAAVSPIIVAPAASASPPSAASSAASVPLLPLGHVHPHGGVVNEGAIKLERLHETRSIFKFHVTKSFELVSLSVMH